MKNIVALIDFSDATFKLLKQAHDLALAFDSRVILLHVVPPEPVVVEFGASPSVYGTPSLETVKAVQDRMAELQESLTKFGVRTSALQIQARDVDDLMVECRRMDADLIIVGSHRHGTFYNLLRGSITGEVLKLAPCPVLVVPAEAPQEPEAPEEAKKPLNAQS